MAITGTSAGGLQALNKIMTKTKTLLILSLRIVTNLMNNILSLVGKVLSYREENHIKETTAGKRVEMNTVYINP